MHFAKWVLWILLSSTSFAIEILFWDRVILEEHLFKVLWHIQSHFSKVYNYILDMLDWTPMYHGLIKKRWKKKKTSHRKYLIFLDLNGGEKSIFVGKRRRKAGGVTDGWLPVGRPIVRRGGGASSPDCLQSSWSSSSLDCLPSLGHLAWLGYYTPCLTKQNEDTIHLICTG